MKFQRRLFGFSVLVTLGGVALSPLGCGSDATTTSGTEGFGGDGSTSSASGTGGRDATSTVTTFVGTTATGTGGGQTVACTTPCDAATEICSHGVCVPLVQCTGDNDCSNDTYCDPSTGCQPWDGHTPKDDPSCVNLITPGVFAPTVKCEFSKAPTGDAFPRHVDVQSTPVVANFNAGGTGKPSIAVAFSETVPGTASAGGNYEEGRGVIRVLKGDDCSLEANLGGVDLDADGKVDWIVSSSSLAVGDLDGDGQPEIVAYGADGSTIAFTKKSGAWALLWKVPLPAGAPWGGCSYQCDAATNPDCGVGTPPLSRCPLGWAGPSIHDLDDDGKPEVIREGVVFDGATGAVKTMQPTGWVGFRQGNYPVLANLDDDPLVEMTDGASIWKYDSGVWTVDPTFTGPGQGFIAVADFGAFGGSGVAPTAPEIVVVRSNTVAIYAIDGTVVMAPVAVPGLGGGPPTIADFDGDGLPEIGVAGADFYTVYDLDCGPAPRANGQCKLAPCDFDPGGVCPAQGYIAWSRSSQDHSSNVTGSSVFDFEGDGASEVVYADECFVRVYDGSTGEVVFSQYHSSCTWYENPIVADVDGNFRADLVTPSNKACSPVGDTVGTGIACTKLDANGVDALFAGLHCKKNADCYSNVCDEGLCRCTAGAQCCPSADDAACLEDGFACVPPPAGTPGTGNTCRAAHPHGVSGIRVYSDAHDKWVRSRAIWNQHAYAVTNVNEDGTIPATHDWKNNWDDPKLNNFRQNVPGTQNGNATGDLTAGASDEFSCGSSGDATLHAPVCNRGADPVADGLSVGFYVDGTLVCSAKTKTDLAPGACETVDCQWATPPSSSGAAVDVTVTPNDKHQYAECKPSNNDGTVKGVFCKPIN